ncbi:MAG TPA: co-chaperone GroES [Clostridiales bacterium]|nr:co-chaperone GroES [Clostridiales bacterium]
MKIKPLLDKVVLEQIEPEEKTESGILLPSSSKEKPAIAKVVAVGEGGFVDGYEVKMLVKVGDKVLYSKYAGSDVKIENKDYIVIKQADILAVIE